MTINGYYPTGIELSAEGKSPISSHRYLHINIETPRRIASEMGLLNKDIDT
jgi:hypothetical protein